MKKIFICLFVLIGGVIIYILLTNIMIEFIVSPIKNEKKQTFSKEIDMSQLNMISLNNESIKPLQSCWSLDELRYIHENLVLTKENDGYICEDCREFVPKRYGFTDDDVYLLAQLICGDAATDGDGEYDIDYQEEINYYELSKVLSVVMNRQRDERFPDTVKEIVLANGQFSVFPRNLNSSPSEKALKNIRDWCEAYDRYNINTQCAPEDHVYFTGDGITNHTRR